MSNSYLKFPIFNRLYPHAKCRWCFLLIFRGQLGTIFYVKSKAGAREASGTFRGGEPREGNLLFKTCFLGKMKKNVAVISNFLEVDTIGNFWQQQQHSMNDARYWA